MMSTRYTHREVDGDISDKSSALEMAIDSHWYDPRNKGRTHIQVDSFSAAQSFYHQVKLKMVNYSVISRSFISQGLLLLYSRQWAVDGTTRAETWWR